MAEEPGFDWDAGNIDKLPRHHVRREDAEDAFRDPDLAIVPAKQPDATEYREAIIGMTEAGRILFVVFTRRAGKLRVISARDASPKERQLYSGEL
jgi:uncharacterized DUF497 family protein